MADSKPPENGYGKRSREDFENESNPREAATNDAGAHPEGFSTSYIDESCR